MPAAPDMTPQDFALDPAFASQETHLRRINAVNARLARAKRGSWAQAYLRKLLGQVRRIPV